MLRTLAIFVLSAHIAGLAQQHTDSRATGGSKSRATHGRCAEDGEPVGYPLEGWVGYTNTGTSVTSMLVEARTSPDTVAIATTKTDTEGRFSFSTLKPGKYYLKGTKKLGGEVIRADDIVTVAKGKKRVACLVAEGEATDQTSAR